MKETALVISEGFFGTFSAKTTAGLIRHSEKYEIVGVIDSSKAGQDAGWVSDGKARDIPIFESVNTAVSRISNKVDWLIVGVAPVGGKLPGTFRVEIATALKMGISVVAGLHQYLEDDEEFREAARQGNAIIRDIRKQPPLEELHPFSNRVKDIQALRIPVLGTDSSIGKRTTAIELVKSLNDGGVKATLVATGQTGLLQGAKYGLPLDSIMGDYMVGELEHQIILANENEHPRVIVIEGQGGISHPAYVCGSRAIITASQPNAVILQHAPARKYRNYRRDELQLPMPGIEEEIALIEVFSGAKVIAITINDTGMEEKELEETIADYEKSFGVPTLNVLSHGCGKIIEVIEELL